MKALILTATLFFITCIVNAQKVEVEAHSVEYKCQNCSHTASSRHVERIIRIIDGDEKEVEKLVKWHPKRYRPDGGTVCNNTRFRHCEWVVISEKDCDIELDYGGIDLYCDIWWTMKSKEENDACREIMSLITNAIKNCR